MRCLLFVVIGVGCSSSEVSSTSDAGNTPPTDAPSGDVAAPTDADAAPSECVPGAVNTLSGAFPTGSSLSQPAFEPKTVLRIDRASAPGRPFVIFLAQPLTCAAFADKDWTEHIDGSRFVYVELGGTALATYSASEVEPPSATGSYIAHGSGSSGGIGFPVQYTRDGASTVTAYSSTSIAGTFTAGFVGDPTKPLGRVCGRFEATACAVTW